MKSSTIIVLVVGPPFSDLYDYCLAHRSEDDRIVDFGTIAKALGYDPDQLSESSLRQVNDQRNAMLNSVRRGESTSTRVWITSSNPNAERLFPHHTVVVVANNNIQHDNNDQRQMLIDEWYAARQGRSTGTDQPSREW
jgi:hypothetical protein